MKVFGELSFYILITCLIFFVQASTNPDSTNEEKANEKADETTSQSIASGAGDNQDSKTAVTSGVNNKPDCNSVKTVDLGTTKEEAKEYFDALLNQRQSRVYSVDFVQKLDHLDRLDNRTWTQRVYLIDEFEKIGGPVLFMVGGFKEIGPEAVEDPGALRLAKRMKSAFFIMENRYHGRSIPTKLNTEDLEKYSTAEQTLHDIEYFISKSTRKNMKWIVIGDGYGGTLAAWFRMKYPHAASASVAYNAQLKVLPENKETYEVFQKELSAAVKTEYKIAFDELRAHITNTEYEELKKKFNMCTRLDEGKKKEDNVNFMFWSILVYLQDGIKKNHSLTTSMMVSETEPNALDRLAFVIKGLLNENYEKCLSVDYDVAIQKYKNINIKYSNEIDYPKALKFGLGTRAHHFQRCSEFGMFETSDGKHTFGHSIPLDFFIKFCVDIFDVSFDSKAYISALDSTNMIYGGQNIGATNLIYMTDTEEAWECTGLTTSKSKEIIVIRFGDGQTSNMKSQYDVVVGHLKEWTKKKPVARVGKRKIEEAGVSKTTPIAGAVVSSQDGTNSAVESESAPVADNTKVNDQQASSTTE